MKVKESTESSTAILCLHLAGSPAELSLVSSGWAVIGLGWALMCPLKRQGKVVPLSLQVRVQVSG